MDYIWLITVAGFIIVMVLHEKSIKRRFGEAQEEVRENRALDSKIARLYKEIEEMLDSFEAYVGEAHEELEKRRDELLTMSRQATTLYLQVMQPGVFAPKSQLEEETVPLPAEPDEREKTVKKPAKGKRADAPAEDGKNSRLSPRELAELEKMTSKAQKIRYLTGKGFNINEIARELNMGKGEINLILDLDKG
jgi:hypothetical protein